MGKNLDRRITALLDSLGYSTLYPPQELAISKGVLEGRNLLITTPTASGKTMVALMAAIKTIEKGLKVAYLTPLRALAAEKCQDFHALNNPKIFERRIKIELASSDYDSPGEELADADITILTNEKMDSLMRHRSDWISEVGLFVIDEVHFIGDRERGPVLEMMLTIIRKMYPRIQLLALSATVVNSTDIASWLGCELVDSKWRPTELIEGVYQDGIIKMSDGSKTKIKSYNGSSNAIIDLVEDSMVKGIQTLVFAETRKCTSSLAKKVAGIVFTKLNENVRKMALEASSQLLTNGEDTEITSTLSHLISKGVAFHHAGIGSSSRKIIEESFKKGIIRILFTTPTLASGVNLPARRVIMSNILRYDSDVGSRIPISILEYKQICGRGGRPKYDEKGESIIIAGSNLNPDDVYDHYVLGTPEPLRSQLANNKAIRIHVLSTIVTIPGIKKTEIIDLFQNTLLALHYREPTLSFKITRALDYLHTEHMIKTRKDRYIVTEFGKKISLLYIDPSTGIEFRKAIESIKKPNGENHALGFLHIITSSVDFYPRLALRSTDYDTFSAICKRDANQLIFDINECEWSRSLLALYEWINESSDRKLSEKLGVEPGDMYRIVEISNWLAYALYQVAKTIGRGDLLSEIYKLRIRIKYGIKEELSSLVQLRGIGRIKARSLYNAGITDLTALANTPESKLSAIPKIGMALARMLKGDLTNRMLSA
jgi:helicase